MKEIGYKVIPVSKKASEEVASSDLEQFLAESASQQPLEPRPLSPKQHFQLLKQQQQFDQQMNQLECCSKAESSVQPFK